MEINTVVNALTTRQAAIQPADIARGLGGADRAFLATCVALFEDTSLAHRIDALFEQAKDWASRKASEWQGAPTLESNEARRLAEAIQTRSKQWLESGFNDAQMRLVLWMYLREAFELPARTCVSTRSTARSCDDLTARLVHFLEPRLFHKLKAKVMLKEVSPAPITLDSVARQTMEELMREMLDSTDPVAARQRAILIDEARDRIRHLGEQDRVALLDAIGAEELNDAAIRNILLTGGGLTLFSASVGWAGFSAYILAAQASAFIPLVSGPALVSLVSVLSNPLSVIAIAGGGGWWMAKRAQRHVSQAVAVRVIALLAMNGLCAGPAGLRAMAVAFRSIEGMRAFNDLDGETLRKYQQDWLRLKPAWRGDLQNAPAVVESIERPHTSSASSRLADILGLDPEELRDTAALSALTVGDVLWHIFAIDPSVLQAADFSHVGDLGNVVEFAAFAETVTAMDAASRIGEISDLKGYVAERLVASQLSDAGYQVTFPADPNQAGWDISVDGVQVQIKDTNSFDYLQHHFDTYGDQYPVIVNSEMAAKILEHHPTWADNVYTLDGYSNELVQHITRQSMNVGAHVEHPHVPMFTLALSACRNYRRFSAGRITGEQAVHQVLLDGGSKMALAGVGSTVGPWAGLLVFGPAGALIFGAAVPIVSQMQSKKLQGLLDQHLTSQSYIVWKKETRLALQNLTEALRVRIRDKADLLKAQIGALKASSISEYLHWRTEDELFCLREAWCRLKDIENEAQSNLEVAVARLLEWLTEAPVHPITYQDKLKSLAEIFQQRPAPGDRMMEQVKTATNAVRNYAKSMVNLWMAPQGKPEQVFKPRSKPTADTGDSPTSNPPPSTEFSKVGKDNATSKSDPSEE